MKLSINFSFIFTLIFFVACNNLNAQQTKQDRLSLWYNKPAKNWNEALPVGNGHVGVMIFGGADKEQIQFNDNTLYSGEPSVMYKDVKITTETFSEVVKLMKEKKFPEATDMVCENWLGRLHQYYQPFGDLYIQNNKRGKVSEYKRELNISNAIATTSFKQGGVTYKREVFASNPDNVIIIRIQADKPNAIDVYLNFESHIPLPNNLSIKIACCYKERLLAISNGELSNKWRLGATSTNILNCMTKTENENLINASFMATR